MEYKIRTIIPAAGFGTRVSMPAHKSKELIEYNGKPLIEHTIYRAINPLVVTRSAKVDLIEYLLENKIDYLAVEETKEWPDSILKAKAGWGKKNIVMFPDSTFVDDGIVERLLKNLDINNSSFGVFPVLDSSKWCVLKYGQLYEKQKGIPNANAFGIVGFKNTQQHIFEDLLDTGTCKLDSFDIERLYGYEDLTRGINGN